MHGNAEMQSFALFFYWPMGDFCLNLCMCIFVQQYNMPAKDAEIMFKTVAVFGMYQLVQT